MWHPSFTAPKGADIMSRFAEGSFDGLVPECLCSEKRIFVNRVRALARIWNPRCLLAFGSWSFIEVVVPVLFNTGSSGGVGIGRLAVAALLPCRESSMSLSEVLIRRLKVDNSLDAPDVQAWNNCRSSFGRCRPRRLSSIKAIGRHTAVW
jgi:hypothetical protein